MKTELDWTTTALVLVDPQVDLLAPSGKAWDIFGGQVEQRGTVARLVELRDAAAAAGAPIFYSRIEISEAEYEQMEPRNPLGELFAQRRLLREGEGSAILPELEPTAGTVVLSPRKGPSSVHSDMADRLRERGVETIVIAGMVANLCVESHVRDAVDDGFRVIVAGDAVATFDDQTHDGAMANFGLLATEVVNTEEIVASLSSATLA